MEKPDKKNAILGILNTFSTLVSSDKVTRNEEVLLEFGKSLFEFLEKIYTKSEYMNDDEITGNIINFLSDPKHLPLLESMLVNLTPLDDLDGTPGVERPLPFEWSIRNLITGQVVPRLNAQAVLLSPRSQQILELDKADAAFQDTVDKARVISKVRISGGGGFLKAYEEAGIKEPTPEIPENTPIGFNLELYREQLKTLEINMETGGKVDLGSNSFLNISRDQFYKNLMIPEDDHQKINELDQAIDGILLYILSGMNGPGYDFILGELSKQLVDVPPMTIVSALDQYRNTFNIKVIGRSQVMIRPQLTIPNYQEIINSISRIIDRHQDNYLYGALKKLEANNKKTYEIIAEIAHTLIMDLDYVEAIVDLIN